MGEKTYLERVLARIPVESRRAFCAASLTGILAHMFMLTNKLINHDELIMLFCRNSVPVLGRWLLKYFSQFGSHYSLPAVNGVIAIFALSAAAAVIVDFLQIKRKSAIYLLAAALVTFYSVYETLTYMFTVDAYFISLLLCTIGVYASDRYKHGYLIAVPLYVISLAVYQAYICSAIALCVIRMLQILLSKRSGDREVLIRFGRLAGSVLLAVVVYVPATKLISAYMHWNLSGYNNVGTMGSISAAELLQRIGIAYQTFFSFYIWESMQLTSSAVALLHGAAMAAIAAGIVWILLRSGRMRPLQIGLLFLLVLTIPLTFNAIELFGAAETHPLMRYSFVMLYALLAAVYEAAGESLREKPLRRTVAVNSIAELFLVAVLFVCSMSWAVAGNKHYLVLHIRYENTYAMVTRLVQTVERDPAYTPGMPVLLYGEFSRGNYPMVYATDSEDLGTGNIGAPLDGLWLLNYYDNFHDFARLYLGVTINKPPHAKRAEVIASEAFRSMPNYPEQGSCRVLDGVFVIKISD